MFVYWYKFVQFEEVFFLSLSGRQIKNTWLVFLFIFRYFLFVWNEGDIDCARGEWIMWINKLLRTSIQNTYTVRSMYFQPSENVSYFLTWCVCVCVRGCESECLIQHNICGVFFFMFFDHSLVSYLQILKLHDSICNDKHTDYVPLECENFFFLQNERWRGVHQHWKNECEKPIFFINKKEEK